MSAELISLFIHFVVRITFDQENLVLKIGGYRGRHLFNFGQRPNEQPALNTTAILQFSKHLLEFSTLSDLKVITYYIRTTLKFLLYVLFDFFPD